MTLYFSIGNHTILRITGLWEQQKQPKLIGNYQTGHSTSLNWRVIVLLNGRPVDSLYTCNGFLFSTGAKLQCSGTAAYYGAIVPSFDAWWGPPFPNPSHSLALTPVIFVASKFSKKFSVGDPLDWSHIGIPSIFIPTKKLKQVPSHVSDQVRSNGGYLPYLNNNL